MCRDLAGARARTGETGARMLRLRVAALSPVARFDQSAPWIASGLHLMMRGGNPPQTWRSGACCGRFGEERVGAREVALGSTDTGMKQRADDWRRPQLHRANDGQQGADR